MVAGATSRAFMRAAPEIPGGCCSAMSAPDRGGIPRTVWLRVGVARRLAGCAGRAAHAPPPSNPAGAHLRMLPRGFSLPLRSFGVEFWRAEDAALASTRQHSAAFARPDFRRSMSHRPIAGFASLPVWLPLSRSSQISLIPYPIAAELRCGSSLLNEAANACHNERMNEGRSHGFDTAGILRAPVARF